MKGKEGREFRDKVVEMEDTQKKKTQQRYN